jgi:hypothetical protein
MKLKVAHITKSYPAQVEELGKMLIQKWEAQDKAKQLSRNQNFDTKLNKKTSTKKP